MIPNKSISPSSILPFKLIEISSAPPSHLTIPGNNNQFKFNTQKYKEHSNCKNTAQFLIYLLIKWPHCSFVTVPF